MKHVLDMTPAELAAEMEALGEPAYRARQVEAWVWKKGVCQFAAMTDLPAGLRTRLAGELSVLTSTIAARRESTDGTVKLLLDLHDGEQTETVLIPSSRRTTACVSVQVGCGFGCRFCASGLGGLARDLTGGEILEQVLHLQLTCATRVTNVVFMGMGEPLANYEATLAAVRAIIDPQRLGISARSVTVSTVGLPGQIRRLAAEDLPITLAISLHAPNDALRRQLIPAAAGTSIEAILSAAEAFFRSRKREITLEYVLLDGLNDTNVCAEALARIAGRLRCNVNLIRYNPIPSLPYERPSQVATKRFVARLRRRGVNVHVRRPRGLDVSGACGQLRRAVNA